MSKKNYVDEKINELTAKIAEVKKELAGKACTMDEYKAYRVTINVLAIKAVTGTDFTQKKNKYKIKFIENPTKAQIGQVTEALDDYIKNFEDIMIDQAKAYAAASMQNSEDDLEVNIDNIGIEKTPSDIKDIEKKNLKNFIDMLFGDMAATKQYLTASDLIKISGVSEEVEKHVKTKKRIIYGGAAVLIIAAAATGFFIFIKDNDKDMDLDDPNLDEDDITIDEDEITLNDDNISLNDDVPHVEI